MSERTTFPKHTFIMISTCGNQHYNMLVLERNNCY